MILTIVIPGTDDTKKEPGSYTIPDGYPNSVPSPSPSPSLNPSPTPSPSPSSAPTASGDSHSPLPSPDPEPDNPNVPFASISPDHSGEVTPEVLQEIHDIISKHKNYECVECAAEIEAYLRKQGIHGEGIKLDTVKQRKQDDYIYDDSQPLKAASDYIVSENGHHEGIAIKINGEEKVFDNLHPDGVPTQQWMNNLTYFGKEYPGDDFRKSGYLF